MRYWYHEGEQVEQKTPYAQLGGILAPVAALLLPRSPGLLLHAPSPQPGCLPVPSQSRGNWAEAAGPGKKHHHPAGNSYAKQALIPAMAPPEATLAGHTLPLQGGAHHQVPLRKPELSFSILEKDK